MRGSLCLRSLGSTKRKDLQLMAAAALPSQLHLQQHPSSIPRLLALPVYRQQQTFSQRSSTPSLVIAATTTSVTPDSQSLGGKHAQARAIFLSLVEAEDRKLAMAAIADVVAGIDAKQAADLAAAATIDYDYPARRTPIHSFSSSSSSFSSSSSVPS